MSTGDRLPRADDIGRSTRLGSRARSSAEAPAGDDDDGRRTRLGARRAAEPPVAASPPTRDGVRGRAVIDEAPAAGETRLGSRARPGAVPVEAASRAVPTERGERARGGADKTDAGARTPESDDPGPVGGRERDDTVVRFGPGVPREQPTSPAWSVAVAPVGTRPRRRPGRRWVGALVSLMLLAGGATYLMTHTLEPLRARAQSVAAAPDAPCDVVVDVVGTIATNGRPGTVAYRWERNDGQPTAVLTQAVPSGAMETQVHMPWSVSGQGRFGARVTLRVLAPSPSEATGGFTYSCP